VGIDFVDDLGQATFFGQGFAQSEVKDLGVFRRWPSALNGVEDIVWFAEVLLPQASTSSPDPTPFGVVVIGISVDAFFSKRSMSRAVIMSESGVWPLGDT